MKLHFFIKKLEKFGFPQKQIDIFFLFSFIKFLLL